MYNGQQVLVTNCHRMISGSDIPDAIQLVACGAVGPNGFAGDDGLCYNLYLIYTDVS